MSKQKPEHYAAKAAVRRAANPDKVRRCRRGRVRNHTARYSVVIGGDDNDAIASVTRNGKSRAGETIKRAVAKIQRSAPSMRSGVACVL